MSEVYAFFFKIIPRAPKKTHLWIIADFMAASMSHPENISDGLFVQMFCLYFLLGNIINICIYNVLYYIKYINIIVLKYL